MKVSQNLLPQALDYLQCASLETNSCRAKIRIGPARHRVSRALWARNPGRVRKESRKSPLGRDPQSPRRVRPGVAKESEKSPKPDFRTLFGLFCDSGAHPSGTLSGLFSDSSGVPGPKGPGDPVPGGADPKARSLLEEGKRPPTPQDEIQHLVFTKDPRPLYYKTPPCAFYHKFVRSKAGFGP